MKKRLFLLAAGAALSVGGFFLGKTHTAVVHAETKTSIMKSYGKCIGVYTRGEYVILVFEDGSGTVRLVNASDGSLVGEDTRN
jgi:hypothetical protein